jgi:hypothetical protein
MPRVEAAVRWATGVDIQARQKEHIERHAAQMLVQARAALERAAGEMECRMLNTHMDDAHACGHRCMSGLSPLALLTYRGARRAAAGGIEADHVRCGPTVVVPCPPVHERDCCAAVHGVPPPPGQKRNIQIHTTVLAAALHVRCGNWYAAPYCTMHHNFFEARCASL